MTAWRLAPAPTSWARSCFGATALAGALLGALTRFLEAVGFAVDGQDFGVVDEAIDERDDTGGVGEDFAPFSERSV